jgi:hypothetical protein
VSYRTPVLYRDTAPDILYYTKPLRGSLQRIACVFVCFQNKCLRRLKISALCVSGCRGLQSDLIFKEEGEEGEEVEVKEDEEKSLIVESVTVFNAVPRRRPQ